MSRHPEVGAHAAAGDFEQRVVDILTGLKEGIFGSNALSGRSRNGLKVELLTFTRDRAEDKEFIRVLTEWRHANIAGFTKIFRPSYEGTRSWARGQLIDRNDRILFFVREPDGPFTGHVGLSSFDFTARTFEIDNVVRGESSGPKGIMQAALEVLLEWGCSQLGPVEVQLRTLHDNTRALVLYHRLDFEPFALHPLRRVEGDGYVEWIPAEPADRVDRFMVAMRRACA
jgi:RimJ/RimL family protein N-acetyltransferase